MPPQATVKIDGIKPLLKKLDRIAGTGSAGKRRAKAMMRKAVRAGAAVIRKKTKGTVPTDTGNLKRSLAVKVKQYPSGVSVGLIGPRAKFTRTRTKKGVKSKEVIDAFYAHMVEGGTKPHQIPKRVRRGQPLAFSSGGTAVVTAVAQHPGIRAQPFIQKAAKRSGKAAVAAFGKKLATEIKAEALKNA